MGEGLTWAMAMVYASCVGLVTLHLSIPNSEDPGMMNALTPNHSAVWQPSMPAHLLKTQISI